MWPDEAALVAAVLRKERKASAEFVSRLADPVYRYVSWRLSPAKDLVEDIVQEVFLEAWRSLPRYRGEGGLEAWVMSIARHRVQDHYRRRLRSATLSEDALPGEAGDAGDLEQQLFHRQEYAMIRQVLDALPEAYRIVLTWRYWEDRSAAEMAGEIGRSEKAVERLLARARAQFRNRYQDLAG